MIVPEESGSGVRRIAQKVSADITQTSGAQPVICASLPDGGEGDTEKHRSAKEQQTEQRSLAEQQPESQPKEKQQSERQLEESAGIQAVFAVTDGGKLAERLAERYPALKDISGKRESYAFYLLEYPLGEAERVSETGSESAVHRADTSESGSADSSGCIKNGLVIYGSDRLGTIYGLFHLSELLGVTPYIYWGDAKPVSYERILLGTEPQTDGAGGSGKRVFVENFCSKEPSVKYRGFFINDEWPCFGNWTFSHFGGFTAQMYDHVFEYLLRLKGNYLWPAMWTSSFLLDGPGLASMELADEYGIYIGMSHHEPCMRSGEEFTLVKGEDSPYGTDWSYVTNKEGILRFWEDGLKRSRGHQAFPTIGMRGERDSKMLGEDSEISENVRLLKEIITNQRKMIAQQMQTGDEKIPQLFAVYKEVEDYYFGDSSGGLRGFEELSDVTLLLCEDNFGNMRALPEEAERGHQGGFGMYYHLDYHGDPVSYEWMPSVPLSKIWEQMTQAYEYGVRELWVVNVGDLKFQEYPLGYFMNLAYDFDKWGSSAKNQTKQYTRQWLEQIFGAYASEQELEKAGRVLDGFFKLNGLRRPESLHSEIYHPAHYHESRRMMQFCETVEQENEQLRAAFKERGMETAYESMIYYPAAASANLLKMHLYAGYNHLYAAQGKAIANEMGERMERCILRDEQLTAQIAAFEDGKWAGMEMASHIGFTNWNDEDWRYPVRHVVRLAPKPRLTVSKADETAHFTNQYFPKPLEITFEYVQDGGIRPGADELKACIQIADGGQGILEWQIQMEEDCGWLRFSAASGKTALQDEIWLTLLPDKLAEKSARTEESARAEKGVLSEMKVLKEEVSASFRITAGEQFVPVQVRAVRKETAGLLDKTFIASGNVFTIDAVHCAENRAGQYQGNTAAFEPLTDFGKYGSGMKVFPVTASFGNAGTDTEHAPSLTYRLWAETAGDYCLNLHTSPANPLVYGGKLHFAVCAESPALSVHAAAAESGNIFTEVEITGDGYKGGEPGCVPWEQAVLDQEHVGRTQVHLEQGLNQITVSAREAGIVLERIVLYPADAKLKTSYLGAAESWRKTENSESR